jgi:hypothetical protein
LGKGAKALNQNGIITRIPIDKLLLNVFLDKRSGGEEAGQQIEKSEPRG